MSRSDTIVVGNNALTREKPATLQLSDARRLTVDLSPYCGLQGLEIESAAWSVNDSSESATVTYEQTATKLTSALVTASQAGLAEVQCTVTLDNGEVLIFLWRICVEVPEQVMIDRYCC